MFNNRLQILCVQANRCICLRHNRCPKIPNCLHKPYWPMFLSQNNAHDHYLLTYGIYCTVPKHLRLVRDTACCSVCDGPQALRLIYRIADIYAWLNGLRIFACLSILWILGNFHNRLHGFSGQGIFFLLSFLLFLVFLLF